jgi:hypothetical protein
MIWPFIIIKYFSVFDALYMHVTLATNQNSEQAINAGGGAFGIFREKN